MAAEELGLDPSLAEENATLIQSSYRGYVVRSELQTGQKEENLDNESETDKNAVLIQSAYRGYVVRTSETAQNEVGGEEKTELEYENAVIIQSAYRGYAYRTENDPIGQEDFDASTVHSEVDETQNASEHENAVIIQSAYRGYQYRKDYTTSNNQNTNAIIIQSAYRGYAYRQEAGTIETQDFGSAEDEEDASGSEEESATVIQAAVQGYQARKSYYYQNMANQSALIIQSSYRGYITRKKIGAMSNSQSQTNRSHSENVIVIQSAYRGYRARKQMVFDEEATVVQAHARGYLDRQTFHRDQESVRIIQSSIRLFNSHHQLGPGPGQEGEGEWGDMEDGQAGYPEGEVEVVESTEYANIIQSSIRGHVVRKQYADEEKPQSKARTESDASRQHFFAEKESPKVTTRDRSKMSRQTTKQSSQLGERNYTEYLDHSNWVARHDSKKSFKKERSDVSSILATPTIRKEHKSRPLFMLRSVTVGDTSKHLSGLKTSKQVQVQDSDFSRRNTKVSISRRSSHVSFAETTEDREDHKKYRKSPIPPSQPEPWSDEENGEEREPDGIEPGDIGRERKDQKEKKEPRGGGSKATYTKFASSRHHTDLNIVEEVDESLLESARKAKEEQARKESEQFLQMPQIQPNQAVPNQNVPFNPFAAAQPQGYPMQPMYFPFPTPYPYYPYLAWQPQMNTAPPGAFPGHPGGMVTPENTKVTEDSKKPAKPGRNYVKENKTIKLEQDMGSYKELKSKRDKYKDSEEHKREKELKTEASKDELIQTHTTVKDDNRVKVDINLNISGRQLAGLLGIDEVYSPPRMYPPLAPPPAPGMMPFYPPPPPGPMAYNAMGSSRTAPDLLSGRAEKKVMSEDKKKVSKKTDKKTLNPYPVIPPINTSQEPKLSKTEMKTSLKSKKPGVSDGSYEDLVEKPKKEITYKPHTFEEYKKLDLDVKLPAGLGPDWDRAKEKAVGKQRQADYSDKIRKQHEVTLETRNKYPRIGEPDIRERMSKREVHTEYIKTIPKPNVLSG